MLRRLVRRYSQEQDGVVDGADGGSRVGDPVKTSEAVGDATHAFQSGNGGGDGGFSISRKDVVQMEMELEREEAEDETERWIMAAVGNTDVPEGLMEDARATGRMVWVPDEDTVWRKAAVASESSDGASYTVLSADGKHEIEVPVNKCADYDPSHALDLADASRMNQMHEAPLLDLLHRRFRANDIYTNVADVLVSINPYKHIPGLYEIPMPVAPKRKPPSSSKSESETKIKEKVREDLPQTVGGPPSGGSVASRTAALMRGFNTNDKGEPKRQAQGKPSSTPKAKVIVRTAEEEAKSQLSALKTMLAKPHVYGVADRAFQYMAEPGDVEVNGRIRRRNQSILITGESGAGKTEASKHVMRFLITASRALADSVPAGLKAQAATSADAEAKHMEDVLLKSNTVLEAFGNAKTVRNDNSSRFGKYIKLQYDEDLRLVGARTEHFLLEKSRLVHLEDSERNYHVLYQVAKALPKGLREELSLQGGAKSFALLNQGDCLVASKDVDDHVEFKAVDNALSSLDFSDREKKDMWRLLAAILHSGEVRFEDVPGDMEECRFVNSESQPALSPTVLATLWGVDEAVLKAGVMRRTVTAGGTSATVALNAAQAKDNLMALLKHMYRQLFAWINWKINVVFDVPGGTAETRTGAERTFIGILDIFGFEIMATNSFEQLCINFANEVLQRQFNHHIFVLEQQEYGAEGLDVASIPFRDNENIIELISKRPAGLMPILEDQALTGRQAAALKSSFTDKNLLDLFHQQHHRREPHPSYRKPRFDGPEFVILHYAGDVTYNATGFLEKNNDTLQEDLRGLLLSSRIPFLRQLILGEKGNFEKGESLSLDGARIKPSLGVTDGATLISTREDVDELDNTDSHADEGADTAEDSDESVPENGKHRPSSVFDRVNYPHRGVIINGKNNRSNGNDPRGDRGGDGGDGDAAAGGGDTGTFFDRTTLKKKESTRIAAKTTVSNAFRRQLDDLVTQLGNTEPHYIKCIKPNSAKAPGGWSSPLVIEQLRYSGVLEVVRIRREAFPMRVTYKQFYRRFGNLIVSTGDKRALHADDITSDQARAASKDICEAIFGKDVSGAAFQMGKTKMFLRDDGLKHLRFALRQHYHKLAVQIQALWRGAGTRVVLANQQRAATNLQRVARGTIARRRYKQARHATILLQAVVRMRRGRAVVARINAKRDVAATRVQSVARGFVSRKRHARREAGLKLQVPFAAIVRGYVARRRYERYRKGIVTLQAAARAVAVRKRRIAKAKLKARRAAAATVITTTWRGSVERKKFATKKQDARVAAVVRCQDSARVLIARRSFRRHRSSAVLVQRAVRAFLRNNRLRVCSIRAFEAARSGDVVALASHISEWPELLFVRDRHDAKRNDKSLPSYSTLLHAACQGGSIDLAGLLGPFPSDVSAVDRWGNNSVHTAAALCDYDMIKFLARRSNLDIENLIVEDDENSGRMAAFSLPSPERSPPSMTRKRFINATAMIQDFRLTHAASSSSSLAGWEGGRASGGSGGGSRPGGAGKVETGIQATTFEGEKWAGGHPIVEGYLKKKRESGRWHRRWCQIKQYSPHPGKTGDAGPALFYYHKPTDKMPSKIIILKHCLLKKSSMYKNGFELHSPLIMSGNNAEGLLHFQAGSDVELQRWMVPLRVLVKLYDFHNEKRQNIIIDVERALANQTTCLHSRRRDCYTVAVHNYLLMGSYLERAARLPMEFMDIEKRQRLVQAKNKEGRTPLHLAVAYVGGVAAVAGDVGVMSAVQRVSTWLVENGADPNVEDSTEENPMHVAYKAGHDTVVEELASRGGRANFNWRANGETFDDGPPSSLEEIMGIEKGEFLPKKGSAPKRTVASTTKPREPGAPMLPPPSKVFGFTYVSLFLERLTLPSTVRASMRKPALTLSVYSSRGQLFETAQEVSAPTLSFPGYLWWARTWHMQTPLEELGTGAVVIYELRDLRTKEKPAICWGALPLDPDALSTQAEVLSAFVPPADPALLTSGGAVSVGCYGMMGENKGANTSSSPNLSDADLAADLLLTRVLR